jgi:cell division septum initiation protein DivIVA
MTTDTWYDEQKRLTPDRLQAANFPLTRWGRHGLEEGPVQSFLAEVHAEFVRLINERAALWQEVQRLRRRILGQDQGEEAILFGQDDAHAHAVRILAVAQLTAERYVAEAQVYSGHLTQEARAYRDEIVTEAQQDVDTLLEEARAEAREAAVEAMGSEVLPPQTEDERRAAEAELAYLRTFGEVYRQHLKIYTESVQRILDDWASKERAVAARPRGELPLPGHGPGRG